MIGRSTKMTCFALLSVLLGSPPAYATSENALTVVIHVVPASPHVGPVEIDVRVTDSSGKPVTGASVDVLASMPAMKMGVPMPMASMGMLGPTLHASEIGNGHYTAHLDLNHATYWRFVVHAKAAKAYGTALIDVKVLR